MKKSKDSFLIGTNKWSLINSSLQALRYSNRRPHSPELDSLSDFSGPFTAGTSFHICSNMSFSFLGVLLEANALCPKTVWFFLDDDLWQFLRLRHSTESAPNQLAQTVCRFEWSYWAHGWEIYIYIYVK